MDGTDRTRPRWWHRLADLFPYGLAPSVILLLTLLSGGYLGWTGLAALGRPEADLTLWTFARHHYNAYVQARPSFEAARDVTVDMQLVHGDTVSRRLRSAFWAGIDVPDAVEVEITRAGSFFRGPVEDVGFIDLAPYLTRPDPADPRGRPLMARLVQSRFSMCSHKGRIFGLPHDVHPVLLAYRADLFDELGLDAASLTTWDAFIEAGRRVTNHRDRYMINLSKRAAYSLEVFLFQKGGQYFHEDGSLAMDSETAVEALLWYGPLVAGPERIAADPDMFGANFAKSVRDGYCLCSIAPDWKSYGIEKDVPDMAGKMKLMPLPAFEPGGRRTSTWGGTMIGITKRSADRDLTWALVEHLYLDEEDLGERFRHLNILPPYKDAWDHPAFHEPRPYWSGQRLGAEYIAVADQVPPQYGSPFLELAKSKMGEVVAACVNYYDARGAEGYEAFVRRRLAQAADEVRRQMRRNPF